ncbi:NAD(P)/FAD-dependent oxidoreductase [Chitinophagales bacterium]|nr:NAD(P)/FAD-dependent oxidoreductase [Chitinophagales bacterium]
MSKLYDVILVGAGLSGIDAAYRIQTDCPDLSYTIIEAREAIGGTWDLFKYPGIRSDSDMYTLGFPFYPWKNPKAIADGPSILKYIKETAAHFGIDQKIQFNKRVEKASWSDKDKLWTININTHGELIEYQCKFLFMTSGYYNYEQGYAPSFPGSDLFEGPIIHPQQWDENLIYTDKNIIVIGSGATAVTLVPELAKKAKKVTMLQRSPSYIMSLPSEDVFANFLNKWLPASFAYSFIKWKNVLLAMFLYQYSQKRPESMKAFIMKGVHRGLKTDKLDGHFKPNYNPWNQRLCFVPDGDFFKALRGGKAEVVTDQIKEFTSQGIQTNSGKFIEADIIVSATGLKLQLLGGMSITVNDKKIDPSTLHSYKGVMFSDIPNFAFAVGYTNASWTLKSDLNCQFVTRLLNHMKKSQTSIVTPKFDIDKYGSEPLLDFEAGYVKRALEHLPKQGSKKPWKVHQNYIKDTISLKLDKINNSNLEFKQ